MWIGDGQDVVGSVAVVAGGGVFVALLERAPVHTLAPGLDGAHFSEHVFRGKLGIGVAGAAGIGQMLLTHWRLRVARRQRGMRGAVTALTGGNIGVAMIERAAVDAGPVLLYFARVACSAELRTGDGLCHVADAVAGDAGSRVVGIAQRRVSARGHFFGSVRVAGNARHRCSLRVVRLRRGSAVAIDATQAAVRALHVRRRIDGDVFALGILQACGGTMTHQAIGSLLCLRGRNERCDKEENEYQIADRRLSVSPNSSGTSFLGQFSRADPHTSSSDSASEELGAPGGIYGPERATALEPGPSWRRLEEKLPCWAPLSFYFCRVRMYVTTS